MGLLNLLNRDDIFRKWRQVTFHNQVGNLTIARLADNISGTPGRAVGTKYFCFYWKNDYMRLQFMTFVFELIVYFPPG